MKRVTRMVSLDTSSTVTGYAYFENAVLKDSGTIDLGDIKDIRIRFDKMCAAISKYLKEKKPDITVVEQPPFCNSPDTFRTLSEIVGVARGYAIVKGEEQLEYNPPAWRSLVAESDEKIPTKRADCKPWDIQKAENVKGSSVADDNEADAILIGIARVCETIEGVDSVSDYINMFMK